MTEEFDLSNGIQTKDEAEYDLETKKLSTRKKMAWVSLAGILGIMLGVFLVYFHKTFDIERFGAIRPVLETCIYSFTSIVGFFIGSQTFADSKWAKDGVEKKD